MVKKRAVAWLVTLMMLVTAFPAFGAVDKGEASQQVSDEALQKAIGAVKERIDVPSSLSEFNYTAESEGILTYWQLSWYNSKTDERIEVRYSSAGNIVQYYKNDLKEQYSERKKIGTLSREQAVEKANAFLKLAFPKEYGKFVLRTDDQIYDIGNFSVRYFYTENNAKVTGAEAYVSISGQTGEITNFYSSANPSLKYPSADNVIGSEKAAKAYQDELGLKLVYRAKISYDKGDTKLDGIYPVYVPKYEGDAVIDAKTGKKLFFEGYMIPYGGMGDAYASESKMKYDGRLTPSEEKAVKDIKGLLTQDDALKLIKQKFPTVNDSTPLDYISLSKESLRAQKGYAWVASFKQKDSEYDRIYVTIDAATGALLSFHDMNNLGDSRKGEADKASAQKEVETFLAGLEKDKFAQTKYDESYPQMSIMKYPEAGRYLTFYYRRVVNGIPFTDNFLMASYDTLRKKVVQYECTWYDATFPAIDKVLSVETIYEKLFKENPMELIYRTNASPRSNDTITLVYAPNTDRYPLTFDAFTGKRLDYSGEEIKAKAPFGQYEDIKGHFAEAQIIQLGKIGIGFSGKELKPTQELTQKEWLWLIGQTYSYGAGALGEGDEWTEDRINLLYREMQRRGIVKEGERAPEQVVTREQAVVFLIRAFGNGIEKIATKNEIYKAPFVDADTLTPDTYGYVAIAKALNLVKGSDGYFYPQKSVNRGEALMMVYNFLNQ